LATSEDQTAVLHMILPGFKEQPPWHNHPGIGKLVYDRNTVNIVQMQASIEVMKDGGEVEVDVWACCVEATGLHLF
jgi:hypothetical protein